MNIQNIKLFEQRAIIKFLTLEGEKAADIHRRLGKVYKDKCLSYSAVKKWVKRFLKGDLSLLDGHRPGRPAAFGPEIVKLVGDFIKGNKRAKTRELREKFGLSSRSVQVILHQLGMKKVDSQWVPKSLSQQAPEETHADDADQWECSTVK